MFNESKLHFHEERLDKCWSHAELTDFSSLGLFNAYYLTIDIKTNLHIDFTFLIFCTFYIFVNILEHLVAFSRFDRHAIHRSSY